MKIVRLLLCLMILWGTVLTAPVFTQQNGYVYGQVTFGSNCDSEGSWYVQVTDEFSLEESNLAPLNPFNNYQTGLFPMTGPTFTVTIYRLKPSAFSREYRHIGFINGVGNQFNFTVTNCN